MKNFNFDKFIKKEYSMPINTIFCLTERCNLKCGYCYLDINKKDILSKEDIFKIIDKLEKSGIITITFTGGEIFTRKDFLDIYLYTYKKGIKISFNTNGILLNKKIIDFFSKYKPYQINISIRGSNKNIFDKVSGSKIYFDKFIKNLKYLKYKKINVKLSVPMLNIILKDISNIKKISENIKIPLVFNFLIYHNNNLSKSAVEYLKKQRIHPKIAAKYYLDYIIKKKEKENSSFKNMNKKLKIKKLKNIFISDKKNGKGFEKNLFWCDAGSKNLAINYKGEAVPCIYLNSPSFKISKYSIKDIVNNMKKKIKNLKPSKKFKCNSCNHYGNGCYQCPGRGFLELGKIDEKVTYFCDVIKEFKNMLREGK